jgi:hypothetical protein
MFPDGGYPLQVHVSASTIDTTFLAASQPVGNGVGSRTGLACELHIPSWHVHPPEGLPSSALRADAAGRASRGVSSSSGCPPPRAPRPAGAGVNKSADVSRLRGQRWGPYLAPACRRGYSGGDELTSKPVSHLPSRSGGRGPQGSDLLPVHQRAGGGEVPAAASPQLRRA